MSSKKMNDYYDQLTSMRLIMESQKSYLRGFASNLKEALVEAANTIVFSKLPYVTGIGWLQYTHCYEDGKTPCEFEACTYKVDYFFKVSEAQGFTGDASEFKSLLNHMTFTENLDPEQCFEGEFAARTSEKFTGNMPVGCYPNLKRMQTALLLFQGVLKDFTHDDIFQEAFGDGYIKICPDGIKKLPRGYIPM